jgi:hypothetical protein
MAVDAAVDSLGELPREGEQLDIEANLGVEIDGLRFAVSTENDRVVVHAPSVGAYLAVSSEGIGRLRAVAAALDAAGVTVECKTGDATLTVVGQQASPGRLTAVLFSDAVEIRASGILAGLVRLR